MKSRQHAGGAEWRGNVEHNVAPRGVVSPDHHLNYAAQRSILLTTLQLYKKLDENHSTPTE